MNDKQEKTTTPENMAKPRVGISSCLLGEKVRYDGGNKWHRVIVEIIGPEVEWVPVCPEMEIGMGVPREPVNLVGSPKSPALLAEETGKNWSSQMETFSRQKIHALRECRLNGYVFKKASPSCGLRNVKVFQEPSLEQWVPLGIGVFVREFLLEFPDLPVVDEKDLSTERQAVRFMAEITRYHRLHPGDRVKG